MKVSLVLTGLARCWEQAYPSFKQYVLDRWDTDVFIDIWSDIGYYTGKAYLPEENGFVRLKEGDKGFHLSGIVDVQRMIEVYNPISIRIENFDKVEPHLERITQSFTNAYTRPKNTAAQAFKIFRGINQVRETEDATIYDLIIRARPDLILEHPLGDIDPFKFYVNHGGNKIGKGVGDAIQISNRQNMIRFAALFIHLESLYREVGYSCPHAFIEAYVSRQMSVEIVRLPCGSHIAHSPKGLYQEPD